MYVPYAVMFTKEISHQKNVHSVEIGEEPVVNSRYSIVLATAKRARQIIAGSEPLTDHNDCPKALSIAIDELSSGAIKIDAEDDDAEE